MKMTAFSSRVAKEIIRDPLSLIFGLCFPVVLLLLLSAFTPLASLFDGCVLPAGTGFTCFALAAAVPVTGELIKLARTYLLKPGR